MNKKYYKKINECLYYEVLENGLSVYYLPKQDYNKAFVSCAINYGSFDIDFFIDNKEFNMPYGIQHFLEHKMFDMKDYDASIKLSSYGAMTNAYTSYDKTEYQLSTTTNFKESLEIFLNFINTPYYTSQSIKKEVGIIENEIKMYLDYPDEKIQKKLYANMFNNHPITVDIAGTLDSIKLINKDLLYLCYNSFYNPNNMVLFITGNFNLEEARKIIKANQMSIKNNNVIKKELEIKTKPFKNYEEIKLDIYIPKLQFSILLPNPKLNSEKQITYEFCISILTELLFGSCSNYYEELLNNKLINESFYLEVLNYKNLNFITCDAETHYPHKLYERLNEIFSNLDKFLINEKEFNRIKNTLLGTFIKSFNNLENISNNFIRYHFMGLDMFLIPDIIEKIKIEDIYKLIKYINLDDISYLLVFPNDD